MSLSTTQTQTLKSILWRANPSLGYNVMLVVLGSLVLAVSSQLRIPMWPVPLTLQSATVLLIGMVYGQRLGFFTIALYIFEGCIGIPVFAGFSHGTSILFGPSGGYIIGFLPASVLCGYLMQRGFAKSFFGALFTAVIGTIIIFAAGALMMLNYFDWHQVFLFGIAPFLVTEPIKILAVAFAAPFFWKSKSIDKAPKN